ncbi:MAG TPA: N-acetylmuramoyl-L-alanine amidase [Pseudolabrys sp.]|nr:N-acetylmuramoyl-L-alanine amidase [Pseudolabrys sp.]
MTVPGSLKLIAVAGGLAGALVCGLTGAAPAADDSLATASSKSGQFPVASDVRLGGDEKQTRFVMDFDRKVDLATFTLADPYRVVIDLPQVVFRLPPKTGERGRGLIKAFRFGLIMQGGSRIVIDAAGPVRVDKAFALAPGEGQPARLVLDLVTTDRQSFLHDMALGTHVAHNNSAPNVSSTREVPADPRPLIVIDPGHGGIDTGTKSGNGKDEKDVVLAFGLLLRDKLEKTGKYRVIMTRSDDTFIPLWDRVRFARAHKASLFISVHADSIPKSEGQAEGATVYTLSDRASDAQAERLADAENKSDVIAGVDLTSQPDDVANILIDLAQRETKMFSSQFARTLVGEFKGTTRLHQHPLKSAGFIVLKAPDVPSVLVELGYMSTKDDLVNLLSANWRSRTADSLVSAVNTFFAPRLAGAGATPGPD